jgi:hypothetical protein
MRAAEDWGLRRWIRESQSFMAHRPRWQIAVLATLKYPAFDRTQRRDNDRWSAAKTGTGTAAP